MKDVREREPCKKCGAWHGVPPLGHLKPGEDCGHDRNALCILCGLPVGNLSMGGSQVCSWCDMYPTKEKSIEARSMYKIHYGGSIHTEKEQTLPGFPACGTMYQIQGPKGIKNLTIFRADVTCELCLGLLRKHDAWQEREAK